MICEVCHEKHADIVFKTVTGDQVATKAMCLACAQNMQQDMIKMFMALGFRKDQVEEQQPLEEPAPAMPGFICTQCGRPFDQLNEQTMAGCAACYDAMRGELGNRLEASLPQSLRPEPVDESPAPQKDAEEDSLSQLRYQMMEAVIHERFEDAARLRDQISAREMAEGMA